MTAGVLHRGLIDNSPYSKRDFNLSPIPDIQPGLAETHRNIISVIRLKLPLRACRALEDFGGGAGRRWIRRNFAFLGDGGKVADGRAGGS
ncbi:hypothetical protein Zmor_008453 [Zophobas morio]|uniref:Uncharacterized protein n=1 Tax=Zophobas morio TaxID=2755281 RepID=A0AA38J189_9CUCU|nr:hypothetical protein Zmor_008453 [Zophobas morio]